MKKRLSNRPPKRSLHSSMAGFNFLELSIAIAIVGMITGVALSTSTSRNAVEQMAHRSVAKQSMQVMGQAENIILGYAMRTERLPCPDVNDDGREDCAASNSVGTVPYLDIGLSQPFLDGNGNPVRYGVYRNPNDKADLTTISDRLKPWLLPITRDPAGPNDAGSIAAHTGYQNRLDLCRSLYNAIRSTPSSSHVHVKDGSFIRNMSYILASGGMMDADGDGSHFDGINAKSPLKQFETPDRRKSDNSAGEEDSVIGGYDDIVKVMPFGVLAYKQGCFEANMAMKALAMSTIAADDDYRASVNSYDAAVHGVEVAKYERDTAIFNTVMTALDAATVIFDGILTTGQIMKGAASAAAEVPGLVMDGVNTAISIYAAADSMQGAVDGLDGAQEYLDTTIAMEEDSWQYLTDIWGKAAHMDKDQGIKR
ncbi:MAG: type II secretion system protein [Magnetococcales bacterium]|nr:type II secretion system protein [Magnetococcales bacterium]